MELPARVPVNPHLPRETAAFRVGESVVYRSTAGTIVANVATGEHAPDFDPRTWFTLGTGVVVKWIDGTITHVRTPLDVSRRPN